MPIFCYFFELCDRQGGIHVVRPNTHTPGEDFVRKHDSLPFLFFTRHPFTEFLSRIQYFGTMLTHGVLTASTSPTTYVVGLTVTASTSPTTYVVGLTTLFPVQAPVLRLHADA